MKEINENRIKKKAIGDILFGSINKKLFFGFFLVILFIVLLGNIAITGGNIGRNNLPIIIITLIIPLFIALFLGLYISKSISRHILKLQEATQTPDYFIQGRCGEIFILQDNNPAPKASSSGRAGTSEQKEISIGFIGEIHPKILKNWKLKMPVALFEINLEEIYNKLM